MEQPKKYIKVEHKYLETGKEYIQMHPVMIKNRNDERKDFPELQWVQEVPDRESELIEMLEKVSLRMSKKKGEDFALFYEVKTFIQSVKQPNEER